MANNLRYEYDAPTFVDFRQTDLDNNDGADSFFDVRVGLDVTESTLPVPSAETSLVKGLLVKLENLKVDVDENTPPIKTDKHVPSSQTSVVKETLVRLENVKVEPVDENAPPVKTNVLSAETSLTKEIQTRLENSKVEPISPTEGIVNTQSVVKSPVKGATKGLTTPEYPTIRKDPPAVLQEVSTNIMKSKENQKRKFSSPIPGHVEKKKYISLAEGVLQYAKKTPQRFHTRPRNEGYVNQQQPAERKQLTKAHSPNLVSVHRTRKVEYPTREELEEREFQEMKNFQYKANPLKDSVLHPPKIGKEIEKRSPVKVEPFNLTEFKKKDPPPEPVFKFSANPIPKGLFEQPLGLPVKKVIPLTIPKTPCITKPKLKVKILEERDGQNFEVESESCHSGVPVSHWKPGKTEVKPFTFEERDKLLLERKEKKINEILQKEKEAREFRAQPLPKYLKKSSSDSNSLDGSNVSHSHSNCSCTSKDDSEVHQFKARPPVVLHKEPFVPKRPEKPPVFPEEIVLHTEKRAEERKAFDALIQEKESMEQRLLRELQEQREREEAEEIARLRKATVHKANPMPSFRSPRSKVMKKPDTIATSPNFSERFNK